MNCRKIGMVLVLSTTPDPLAPRSPRPMGLMFGVPDGSRSPVGPLLIVSQSKAYPILPFVPGTVGSAH